MKNILERFQPIQLAEMEQVKLLKRVDTKFVFSTNILEALLEALHTDYRVFEMNGHRNMGYDSVYWDTIDRQFYNDHHRGKLTRLKIRHRTYLQNDLTFLEIKSKQKGRTIKVRKVVAEVNASLTEEEKEFISPYIHGEKLMAVFRNQFRRITLVHKTLPERITLDTNIIFFSPDDENNTVNWDKLVVAELKQKSWDKNSPFARLMKKNQIRPTKWSKYCLGSLGLDKVRNLKYNRFKKYNLELLKITSHA